MRILALKPKGFTLPSIHSSMVRAFQSLGMEVIDLPFPENFEDFKSLESFSRQGCEAIFTLDLGGLKNLKPIFRDSQISLKIPWIIWFVDDPEGYGFTKVCEPRWTVPFCWDEEITRRIPLESSWEGIPVAYLPLAVDPEVFFPDRVSPDSLYPGGVFVGSTAYPNAFLEEAIRKAPGFEEELETLWKTFEGDWTLSLKTMAWSHLRKKMGDESGPIDRDPLCRLWVHSAVCLWGLWKRRSIVSRIIEPGGGIFGDRGWVDLVGGLYRGKAEYGEGLRRIYNQSNFNLDIRPSQARTGLSQRIFDASACGCPVLAEFSPEMESLFDPEEEIFSYRTTAEALEKKKRILGDPQKAISMAERARSHVLARHTYHQRALQIMEYTQRFFSFSRA